MPSDVTPFEGPSGHSNDVGLREATDADERLLTDGSLRRAATQHQATASVHRIRNIKQVLYHYDTNESWDHGG